MIQTWIAGFRNPVRADVITELFTNCGEVA